MKTIEILVKLVAQVSDDIGDEINGDQETFTVSLPLANIQLERYNIPKEAKFVEYETLNTEVV